MRKLLELPKFYKSWRDCKGLAPLIVEWIISSKCNMRCQMCNVWKLGIENPHMCKNELSLGEAKNFLREIARLGTKILYISGGEPTLRSDLLEVIRKAKEERLNVSLITNGNSIEPIFAENLVKSGTDEIVFSLDAPHPNPHDTIRGVKGAWERAVDGIKSINRNRTENKVKELCISISFVVTRINYDLIPEMVDLKSQLGFDRINFLPVIAKAVRTKDLLLAYDDLEKLWGLIPTIKAKMKKNKLPMNPLATLVYLCKNRENTVQGKYAVPVRRQIMCFQPWKLATVDPFGNVYPCCYACTLQNVPDEYVNNLWESDKFNMGSLRKNTFKDIWNGDKFVWFRGKSKQPLAFPMCEACGYSFMRDMFFTGLVARRRLLLTYLNKSIHTLYDVA